MKKILAVLILFCAAAVAQTPVNLGTYPQFVSILPSGAMNAFGCVFTYSTGTTTPLATYTDSAGKTLNPNPVPLSGGGTANIWFQNGLIYTVVIKSSGGVNCVSGTTILTVNGVNGTLLNSQNEWFASQTFDATTYFSLSDLQLVFGSPSGTQTTLDVIPQSANYILHMPTLTGNDTLVTQNATQALTNKNLTTGTEINGCGVTNGPATYICIPNNTSTATVVNSFAILTGAPSTATVALTTTLSGIIGIVTAGAGITGSATIQQSGDVSCNFDGATTAGDYVQISSSVAGDCHDGGNSNPTGSLGTVFSTNVGSGLYLINLALQPAVPAVLVAGNVVTVNANTTAAQETGGMTFPAGTLNVLNRAFIAYGQVSVVPGGGASNQQILWGFGGATTNAVVTTTSASSTINATLEMICVVTATGSSGALSCSFITFSSSGTLVYTRWTPTADLTSTLTVADFCSFSVASTSNSCTGTSLILQRLN